MFKFYNKKECDDDKWLEDYAGYDAPGTVGGGGRPP